MGAQFDDGGIRFRYPENWQLEREETETGWTVSLQSPETAFLMITMRRDRPKVNQVAKAALVALQEEYPELEAVACKESMAGRAAVGHNINFFALDLTNTSWTRSFYSPQGTVLVLCQVSDLELETNGDVLKAICASLQVDE